MSEFVKAAGVKTLREVTHEAVKKYETAILAGVLSAKSLSHRFCKLRTIIAHALKRGADAKECRQALDVLAMLEAPDHTTLAPHPIGPKEFWSIYDAAKAKGDDYLAASMLLMLNCCMYNGEAGALKWTEVNLRTGEVVTKRPKTKISRVAMLWPQTLAALKKLDQDRDNVLSGPDATLTAKLIWRRWDEVRDELKMPDVKPSDVRDAAYTVACRETNLDQARVLAGHRLPGAADHYIQRNPQFVSAACMAIAKAFGVNKHASK